MRKRGKEGKDMFAKSCAGLIIAASWAGAPRWEQLDHPSTGNV